MNKWLFLFWAARSGRNGEIEQNTEWNNRLSLCETMRRHLDWINLHPKQGRDSSLQLSTSPHICHLPPLHQSLFLSPSSLSASQLHHGCSTCGPRAKNAPPIIFIWPADTQERSVWKTQQSSVSGVQHKLWPCDQTKVCLAKVQRDYIHRL